MNVYTEAVGLRGFQGLMTKYRMMKMPLMVETYRQHFEHAIYKLRLQIEIDLAYEEALDHGEQCTCTPNSDACYLCKLAQAASKNQAIVLLDDAEIPF